MVAPPFLNQHDLLVPGSRITTSQLIHSCIHSGNFYSASSSLLLGGPPDYSIDTASELYVERYMQLQVKDLPKLLTWRLEWDSNLRPFRRKALDPPTGHHAHAYAS